MSVMNFVQVGLVTPVATNTTELVVAAPVAPYQYPPLDGGTLVIADSVARPSFYEVISYTHRIDNVLYGVVRAKEGTTARAWTGTTWIYQALTAADYVAALLLKANLASPQLTGVPTAPTAALGTNTNQIATMAAIQAAIADLLDSSPAALNTLNELAAALGDDPNFAATMNTALSGKEPTIAAGLATQYWKGNKTWADLFADVRAATLTGLGAGSNVSIVSTDTLLQALAKIQNQLNNKCASDSAALTNSREWTADTVTQTVAEAGTDTTRTAWTAQRVAQAIRGNILSGLNLTVTGAVSATDTLLTAIGKLQKQITDAGTNLAGNIRSTVLTGYQAGSATALAATDTLLAALGKIQGQLDVKAGLNSPSLTGTPIAPTASAGTSTTQLATTAFVHSVVNGVLTISGLTGGTRVLTADEATNVVISLNGTLTSNLILEIPSTSNRLYSISNGTTGAFTVSVRSGPSGTSVAVANGKRNLVFISGSGAYDAITDFDSIALSGAPTAPTAAAGTNTTQIATTAFVNAEIANDAPTKTGGGASGTWPIGVSGNAATATTLSGLTASVAELNYCDGVTSAIQAQLDGKAASNHTHSYAPLNGTGTSGTWPINVSGTAASLGGFAVGGLQEIGRYLDFHGAANGFDWDVRLDAQAGASNSAGTLVVSANGGLVCSGNITAYSDMRLKTDIQVIPDALAKVVTLQGVTYERVDGGGRQTGVIAQEVQAVLPEAITVGTDDQQTLSVAYGNLVGLLIEAIKELDAKVEALRDGTA